MKLPELIGVVHLPALCGAPESFGIAPPLILKTATDWALREARAFEGAGFHGIILENLGDAPYFKDEVPPETISSLSILAARVRDQVRIPIGINVLRNDGRSAIAIATVAGCDFVRINVLSGVAATDQGLVEGKAAFLLRERKRLGSKVAILADVHVKHAQTLSSSELSLAIEDTVGRAGADAVILSGTATGRSVDPQHLETGARLMKTKRKPLFVGSGVTLENLGMIRKRGSGVIVSSSLRKGGQAGAALSLAQVKAFARAYHAIQD